MATLEQKRQLKLNLALTQIQLWNYHAGMSCPADVLRTKYEQLYAILENFDLETRTVREYEERYYELIGLYDAMVDRGMITK